jgi:hypothetical protein
VTSVAAAARHWRQRLLISFVRKPVLSDCARAIYFVAHSVKFARELYEITDLASVRNDVIALPFKGD